ncbi:MAG TPA: kelch repeat-containing protein [Candidatus Acidoferrum sp.]|nr:kelch repeat-containing protein [Candidatus Acidoferrum sp.]
MLKFHGKNWGFPGTSLHALAGWLMLVCLGLATVSQVHGGTWTRLTHLAPDYIGMTLLLPNGTVMAHDSGSTNWYLLTPSAAGSYSNGTWTILPAMNYSRLYSASDVLRDGRVMVAGGEYGTGVAAAEVYDPVTNTWTVVNPPSTLLDPGLASPEVGENQGFYDATSELVSNGMVLVAPVGAMTTGGTLLFNPISNTWSVGPTLHRTGYPDQAESSWVKLADNSILTVDPYGTNSERYIPTLNQWVNDGTVPVSLYDTNGEEGAAVLLPDGRAFFMGGTGHTALYTPSGGTSAGVWSAGPDFPNSQGTSDAPAALLANGNVLCVVGSKQTLNAPASFYEYNPTANSFTQYSSPAGTLTMAIPTFYGCLLDLPDGTVLFSDFDTQLYVYQPAGAILAAGRPGIGNITRNPDGSYLLSGTNLNGISEGSAYGDDIQNASNYPLVRLLDAAGNVHYARTFNWSSTGVMTGNSPQTAEFVLPAGLPGGLFSLMAVANGIASPAVRFSNNGVVLQIVPQPGGAVLSWPAVFPTGTLETTTNLVPAIWNAVTTPISLVGTNYVLTNAVSASTAFYRLKF